MLTLYNACCELRFDGSFFVLRYKMSRVICSFYLISLQAKKRKLKKLSKPKPPTEDGKVSARLT